MNYKMTLVLCGLLAALCAGYLAMLRLERHSRDREFDKGLVFRFQPEELRSVSLQMEDRRPTVAETAGDARWRIVQPHVIEAQNEVWVRVVTTLVDLFNVRTIESAPRDLTPYGLDKPRLTIRAATADGAEHVVLFGGKDSMQANHYAQVDGGDIILVSDRQFRELNRSLLDLRYRYVFTWGEQGITRLEYARIFPKTNEQGVPLPPDESGLVPFEEPAVIIIERDANDVWRLLAPFEGPANQELADRLAREIQFAVGEEYVDEPEDLDLYSLNPPKARLTVNAGKASPPQTVYFGEGVQIGDKARMFAKRAEFPTVFQVDAGLYTFLPKSPDALRENRLLTRKAVDIREIRYRSDYGEVVLAKVDGAWTIAEPIQDATDQAEVSSFISTLLTLRGVDFPPVSAAQAGLSEPVLEIALRFLDDDAPVLIRIGSLTPDRRHHFATLDTGTITMVPADAVNRLMKTPFDLRDKEVFRFHAGSAVSVNLHFEGVDYVFTRDRLWRVDTPEGHFWESQDDMQALLDAFSLVLAQGVEQDPAPESLAPYGLDAPALSMRVIVADGAAGGELRDVGPLRIGDPCPEHPHHRFATVEGRPELFRVRQRLVDQVRQALRGVQRQ